MRLAPAILGLCLPAIAASATLKPEADSETSLRSALDRVARGYLADRCRVGLSIVARANGRTSFSNYGLVRRDSAEAPTPDSVYELASVTKTFVGALAARALVERRMKLDDDFRTYLPGKYPNLALAGKPITLRDLATHTSGLQRDLPDSDALFTRPDFEVIGNQLAALNQGYTRSRSLEALHSVTLRSVPGKTFSYSNVGMRVLGYGLEKVYRQRLENLLRQSILAPLGMSETTFETTLSMSSRRVTPYSRQGSVQPFHDRSAGAAYGLYSTPRDMARYLEWQLNERLPVVARAHTLIRGTADDGQALIWNVGRVDGEAMLWHGGGSFGQTSQMVLFPMDEQGFVLLANDACEGSEEALKGIALEIHRVVR